MKLGRNLEAERMNKLVIVLSEQNRMDDLVKAAQDKEYREQLLEEFKV